MIQSQCQLSLVLYSFFGVQTSVSCSVFIHTRYDHSFCPGVEFFFLELNIKHQSYWRNKRTVSPECSNYIRGYGVACSPGKIFQNLDPRKRHIPHSLDRTQLIHTCILLSFSQSLVIHDSRTEVRRFMIPKF